MLADVLQGQRAVVSFGKREGTYSPWADITLPAFGALPAVTERTTNVTTTTEIAAHGTRGVASVLLDTTRAKRMKATRMKRTKAEMRAMRMRAQQASRRPPTRARQS